MSHETALTWWNRSLESNVDPTTKSQNSPSHQDLFVWEDATSAFLGQETNASLQQRKQQQQQFFHSGLNQTDSSFGSQHYQQQQSSQPKVTFQEGTHIRFIDELFQETTNAYGNKNVLAVNDESNANTNQEGNNNSVKNTNVVLEISGGTGVGKTTLVTSIAASFLAATSRFIFPAQYNTDCSDSTTSSTSQTTQQQPQVIFIDSEYGLHACHLASTVRASIIRMWEKQQIETHSHHQVMHIGDSHERYQKLEQEILSALARIHITRPNDLDIGYVSTLEAIRHALDSNRTEQEKKHQQHVSNQKLSHLQKEEGGKGGSTFEVPLLKSLNQTSFHNPSTSSTMPSSSSPLHTSPASNKSPCPPIMLIIDSLNVFESTNRMLEQTQSGLSGKHDFVRQLQRLLQSQPRNIIVVATTQTQSKSDIASTSNANTSTNTNTMMDPWNKCVTHRISLERVKTGTPEEQQGYEFVALFSKQSSHASGDASRKRLRSIDGNSSSSTTTKDHYENNSRMSWTQMVPFSVTSHGILC